jgi:hypothetical protein
MMVEIAMEISQEVKECNVEGMGKSSSNLSFEELVEKLTIQTNNSPKDAITSRNDDNPMTFERRTYGITSQHFKNLCSYQHFKEMQD